MRIEKKAYVKDSKGAFGVELSKGNYEDVITEGKQVRIGLELKVGTQEDLKNEDFNRFITQEWYD